MPDQRDWPSSMDYMMAVQTATNFATDRLRLASASIRRNRMGMPDGATGTSAIVYRATTGRKDIAIRCFTSRKPGQLQRYRELHSYLGPDRPRYVVDFTYLDREIFVNAEWYPVVEMDWADGQPLDVWITQQVNAGSSLATLAGRWLDIARDMHGRRLAHGDLANDNIRITDSGQIRLIDYDACYVPTLAAATPGEKGHRDFQHPGQSGHYAANADAFPALVIYLSLLAVDRDPELWRHRASEGLIFRAADFSAPGTAPIWRELDRSPDPAVRWLSARLQQMCGTPVTDLPSLGQVVDEQRAASRPRTPQWIISQLSANPPPGPQRSRPGGTAPAPSPSAPPPPAQPRPTRIPARPARVQPAQAQPTPVQPGPVQPGPVQPGPVLPGPVQPGSAQPTPAWPLQPPLRTSPPIVRHSPSRNQPPRPPRPPVRRTPPRTTSRPTGGGRFPEASQRLIDELLDWLPPLPGNRRQQRQAVAAIGVGAVLIVLLVVLLLVI